MLAPDGSAFFLGVVDDEGATDSGLRIHLTDEEDHPIPGVRCAVRLDSASETLVRLTDAAGWAGFGPAGVGRHELAIEDIPTGYLIRPRPGAAPQTVVSTILREGETNVVLRLRLMRAGAVVLELPPAADERPRVSVAATCTGPEGRRRVDDVRIVRDGRSIRIERLPPGPVEIHADVDGLGHAVTVVDVAAGTAVHRVASFQTDGTSLELSVPPEVARVEASEATVVQLVDGSSPAISRVVALRRDTDGSTLLATSGLVAGEYVVLLGSPSLDGGCLAVKLRLEPRANSLKLSAAPPRDRASVVRIESPNSAAAMRSVVVLVAGGSQSEIQTGVGFSGQAAGRCPEGEYEVLNLALSGSRWDDGANHRRGTILIGPEPRVLSVSPGTGVIR